MRTWAARLAVATLFAFLVCAPSLADCLPGLVQVKVVVNGNGFGVVGAPPGATATTISCPIACSECYPAGSMITLTAAPTAGSTFALWDGCTVPAGPVCSLGPLQVNLLGMGSATVTASFTRPTLIARVLTGSGMIISRTPAGAINCGTLCTQVFNIGTSVTLAAIPAPGYDFVGWDSDGCSGTGDCVLTMNRTYGVSANFSPWPKITISKTGSGVIVSNPAGISCGMQCSFAFARGTNLMLMATPSPGASFLSWNAASTTFQSRGTNLAVLMNPCTGSAATCTFAVKSDVTQPATFSTLNYPVTITKTGNARVTSIPAGIDCGTICSAPFAEGSTVTLYATPDTGWMFLGWSGGCTGTTTSCAFRVVGATSVAAVLAPPRM